MKRCRRLLKPQRQTPSLAEELRCDVYLAPVQPAVQPAVQVTGFLRIPAYSSPEESCTPRNPSYGSMKGVSGPVKSNWAIPPLLSSFQVSRKSVHSNHPTNTLPHPEKSLPPFLIEYRFR